MSNRNYVTYYTKCVVTLTTPYKTLGFRLIAEIICSFDILAYLHEHKLNTFPYQKIKVQTKRYFPHHGGLRYKPKDVPH